MPAAHGLRGAYPGAATDGPGSWRRAVPTPWPADGVPWQEPPESRPLPLLHLGLPAPVGARPESDGPPPAGRPAHYPRKPSGPRPIGAAPPLPAHHAPPPRPEGPDRAAAPASAQ